MGNIVKKILVANRGEIALRVVRTAREMGISTVAVYSEQDRNAQYVQLADESYLLSGDTYASTYLNEDLLIGILHRSGANAVHPGYGFLSEVPSFADKVEKAGAIWVGPHPQALIDLGDKITARRVAKSAQVPPVPGISEPVRELRTLLDFSHTYGYPVMMKRTDGGGGRGITVVHDDDEMRRFYMNHDAMQGGDLDEYFIEKFIDKARHVETQCGRDRFGDFTVYSTRDCSVQRRNQKLVEEAPAPFLPDEVINQLETYSRSLFNKVDYIGLGTCEFMVTPHRKVYFLEVNPRLQVEHTVSEEVCGLDLVREQIDIADGGHLTPAPAPRGHSFELRITSEDPATNLTPSSGTLERIVWPSGPGLRIDTGVEQGDNLFLINRAGTAQKIYTALPYVDDVSIRPALPDGLVIHITERIPTAVIQGGEGWWIIDKKGMIVEAVSSGTQEGLARVTGLTALLPAVGTKVAVEDAETFRLESLLELLAAMEEWNMVGKVSEIDLSSSANLQMDYDGRFTVRIPMSADFSRKLRALDAVMQELQPNESGTIDLTREDEVRVIPDYGGN